MDSQLLQIRKAFLAFLRQVEIGEYFDHEQHSLLMNREFQELKKAIEP